MFYGPSCLVENANLFSKVLIPMCSSFGSICRIQFFVIVFLSAFPAFFWIEAYTSSCLDSLPVVWESDVQIHVLSIFTLNSTLGI